jgi:hypothetical protein
MVGVSHGSGVAQALALAAQPVVWYCVEACAGEVGNAGALLAAEELPALAALGARVAVGDRDEVVDTDAGASCAFPLVLGDAL